MNERFRLLADQAQIGIFEDKAFGWSVIAGTDQHLAKFAELIVKECMTNLYLNGYDDAVLQIQKHFGVEE